MPRYLVSSDGPISVKPIEAPDLPGWTPEHPWVPGEGGPEYPSTGGPGWPERPGHGLPPHLPPKDEWPPLPPWLQPGVGLPIPPTPEFPMVPVDPPPEVTDPPEIWPPLPSMPSLPDLSGKTLILARFFVSRHVNFLRWVLVDTDQAVDKAKAALEAIKGKIPVPAPHRQ